MKNIAIVNSVPNKSTGKIATGLYEYLKCKGKKVFFCYGYGEKISREGYYRIDRKYERLFHALKCRLTGIQGSGSKIATLRLITFLKKNNIDTIYGIGLHGYYLNEAMFFEYLIKNDISFIYIMTEEYAYLGKCGYSNGCTNYKTGCGHCPQVREYPKSWFFDRTRKMFKIKSRAYKRMKKVVFVGPEYTIMKARKSPLVKECHLEVIDEAIDTKFYRPRDTYAIEKKLKIQDDKVIIMCIAPLSYKRKGVKYFIELAHMFEYDDRFVFVHVGYDSKSKQKLPRNYIAIDYVNNQDLLAEFYSLADLFVFPSLLDTMPNACLEALACGTPLLCFDISGMSFLGPEGIVTLVKAKDVDALASVVNKTQKKNKCISSKCREYAVARYDTKVYCKKLFDVGENM